MCEKLLQNISDIVGYNIYTDRYYTRCNLAQELQKIGFYLTGTVQTHGKGLPSQMKPQMLKK
jgi:hypothetical protein